MNRKLILSIIFLPIWYLSLNGCAFVPKTIPERTPHSDCELVTSEWDVELVTLKQYQCHPLECVTGIVALPLTSAAISLPIVLIGNVIHMIEKQLRCN